MNPLTYLHLERAPGAGAWIRRGLLLLAPLLASGVGAAGPDEDPGAGVRRLLGEEIESWPEAVALQNALVTLGSGAIPELFDALASGAVPGSSDGPQQLGPRRDLAVEGALERLPRGDLLAFLDHLSASDADRPRRLAALELVGRLGSAKEISLAFRLGTSPAGAVELDVRDGVQEALRAILARDEPAPRALTSSFSKVPPHLRDAAVHALARLESSRGATALTELLGQVPALDPLILAELLHLVQNRARPDAYGLAAIRDCLRDNDRTSSILAALTLVELGDRGSVPDLIDLLESSDERVSRTVNEALRRLTGRKLRADASEWWSWYDAEREWLSSEFFDHEAALMGDSYVQAANAIRELSSHVLFAEQVAPLLVATLSRPGTELVALACAGLGHLRAQSAVVPLIRCLEHEEPRVSAAAHTALRSITGLELGPNPALWRSRTVPEDES